MKEDGAVSSPAVQLLDGPEEQFGVVQAINEAWLTTDHSLCHQTRLAMGCVR